MLGVDIPPVLQHHMSEAHILSVKITRESIIIIIQDYLKGRGIFN